MMRSSWRTSSATSKRRGAPRSRWCEVALAVMATTLSLVVIFLPIAFMNGYAKWFINPFGWDDCVRDHGLHARQLHADADAQLAIPEIVGRR